MISDLSTETVKRKAIREATEDLLADISCWEERIQMEKHAMKVAMDRLEEYVYQKGRLAGKLSSLRQTLAEGRDDK